MGCEAQTRAVKGGCWVFGPSTRRTDLPAARMGIALGRVRFVGAEQGSWCDVLSLRSLDPVNTDLQGVDISWYLKPQDWARSPREQV